MKGNDNPCYKYPEHKCPNRTATCHCTCKEYLEYFRECREHEKQMVYAPFVTAGYEKMKRRNIMKSRNRRRRRSDQ